MIIKTTNMEYEYELKRLENIETLREKIDKVKTAMLTTYHPEKGFQSRPMGTAKLDVDGNLWFFTNEFSSKVQEISADNKVAVTYSDVANNVYVSVTGFAYVTDNREKILELWNPYVAAFFPGGIDDPNLTLLKVDTESAEYWDSSMSQMLLIFRMLKAAFTGKKFNSGEHDTLQL